MTDTTCYLYMLSCEDGSTYTGIAADVEARFQKHRSGQGGRYTKAHRPNAILAIQKFDSRAAASRAERRLKAKPSSDKMAWAQQFAV